MPSVGGVRLVDGAVILLGGLLPCFCHLSMLSIEGTMDVNDLEERQRPFVIPSVLLFVGFLLLQIETFSIEN